MRARIAPAVVLAFGLCLAIAPAAGAAECTLADQTLNQCQQPAPAPEPEPTPEPPQQPKPSANPGHVPEAVSRILVLMNNERRSRALPQFSQRGDVSAISRNHSQAMAAAGTIWHNDAYFSASNKKALDAALLGENVARNVDIDDAHRRLMASPGHRANLLDGRFTVVGLGVYRSSTGSLYVTQNFVQPVTRAAAAPTSASGKSRPAAPPKAAPAASTTTALAPVPTSIAPDVIDVRAAADDPQVLAAAPVGLPGSGPGRPVGATAAAAVLALLATVVVLLHRFRNRFAPFGGRTRR